MKRLFILGIVLLVFGCTSSFNQEKTNYEDETILVGPVNWDGLTQSPYGEWFNPNYLNYNVDEESLMKIESLIQDADITVFIGTWCSDSHVQLPQFYKMMDFLGYDINRLHVVALERLENRDLVSPGHQEEPYNITHVPTFIFEINGTEVGRISEYPRRTIEKDMVEILLGE